MTLQATSPASTQTVARATLPILTALSLSHCLNDLLQSLLPAIYPNLKQDLGLTFGEIGFITLVFQVTASLLQPGVGVITDKKPQPYSLAIGMACSMAGLLLLSRAHVYGVVLIAAAIIGLGSSIFHPEASRVARAASGGRFGFAQSFFQVGGNTGQAIGPLLAALIIAPNGQGAVAWFVIRLPHQKRSWKTKTQTDRRTTREKVLLTCSFTGLGIIPFFYVAFHAFRFADYPFQPVLAWLILSELPPRATFIGGTLVLLAILVTSRIARWRHCVAYPR